jgi:protein subunit release factor B
MEKEVLFRVTAADCDWQYMRGTGPGGQKRNKTESKVRCVHRASGATGESDETRNQQQNKRIAFRKMAETKEFKAWHKIECAKRLGKLAEIEENVINAMDHKTAMLHIAIKLGAAFGLLVVAGFILEDLNTMLPAAGQ